MKKTQTTSSETERKSEEAARNVVRLDQWKARAIRHAGGGTEAFRRAMYPRRPTGVAPGNGPDAA